MHNAFKTHGFPVCANVQYGPCEQHSTVRRSLVECLRGPGQFVAACACFLHSPPDSGHVSQHSSRPCCHSSHPLELHRPRLCCCEADLWALIVISRPKPQAGRQAPTESPWKDLVSGSRREAPLMPLQSAAEAHTAPTSDTSHLAAQCRRDAISRREHSRGGGRRGNRGMLRGLGGEQWKRRRE